LKHAMIRLAALALAISMVAGLTACGDPSGAGFMAAGTNSSASSDSASDSSSASAASQVEIEYSKNLTEDGKWADINLTDYVTLPDYKNITIPADQVTPTEEDLESQRQAFVQQYATATQITDRAVEDGDQVNIDYVGSVDGVEFTGGNTNGSGTTVTAGSTAYVDDFLTQIIGHTPGETFDVVVTFPDDYNDSTDADGNTMVLAGKEAVFKTTINYIEGDPIYPEFDDAFVAENLQSQYGWTTAAQANEEITSTLTEYNKAQYLQNYLLENAQVTEVPEVIINTLLEQSEANLNNTAASYGMSMDYMLMMYGYSDLESFREGFKTQYTDQIKLQMIYEAITDAEGLQPTDDDLKEAFGDNYNTVLDTYGSAYLLNQLRIDNGYNFVMENATVA